MKNRLLEELENAATPCRLCQKEIKSDDIEKAWQDGLCEKCRKKNEKNSKTEFGETIPENKILKSLKEEADIDEEYRTKGSRDRRPRKKRSKIKPSWLKKSMLGKFL